MMTNEEMRTREKQFIEHCYAILVELNQSGVVSARVNFSLHGIPTVDFLYKDEGTITETHQVAKCLNDATYSIRDAMATLMTGDTGGDTLGAHKCFEDTVLAFENAYQAMLNGQL